MATAMYTFLPLLLLPLARLSEEAIVPVPAPNPSTATQSPSKFSNGLHVAARELPQVNPALREEVRAFLHKRHSAAEADVLETKTIEEYILRPLLKFAQCSDGNHGCDPQSTFCIKGLSRWFPFKCVCKVGFLPIKGEMAKCKKANSCNPAFGCSVCAQCCNARLVSQGDCNACAANVCS